MADTRRVCTRQSWTFPYTVFGFCLEKTILRHLWTRRGCQGAMERATTEDGCHHLSGLVLKACDSLRALMQSALPLLIKASASEAVSQTRVWGSWSDLLWHHRC